MIILLSVGLWCGGRWAKHQGGDAGWTRGPASVSGASSVTVEPILNSRTSQTVRRESFHFKRAVHAKLTDSSKGQASHRPFADLDYEGTFFVDSLKNDGNNSKARLSFDLSIRGKHVQSDVPFWVTFAKDGAIRRIETESPDVSAAKSDDRQDMINVLKDFVSIYAFRTRQDTTGTYEARWSETPEKVHFEKTRYRDSKLTSVTIVKSSHDVVLSKTGTLVSMQGMDRVKMAAGTEAIETDSSYELTRQGTSVVKAQAKTDTKSLVPTSIQLEMTHTAFEAPTWSSTQASLNRIQSLGKPARLSLFHDLLKTLKKNPEHLKDFQDWVMAEKNEPGILSFGIGVLATLGTEASQKALVSWFQDLPASRHSILTALSMTEAKLSDDSKNLLNQLIGQKGQNADLAYDAALVLGSEIRKDPSGEVASAVRTLTDLYQTASAGHQAFEQMIYLDAMGNSGSSAFVSVVEQNLASSDEAIRAKGVYAARFMNTSVAQPLILRGLQDPSPTVRLSAVKAVLYQSNAAPYLSMLESYAQQTNAVGVASKQILSGLSAD